MIKTIGDEVIRTIFILVCTATIDYIIIVFILNQIDRERYLFLPIHVLILAGLNYYAVIHARAVIRAWRRAAREASAMVTSDNRDREASR